MGRPFKQGDEFDAEVKSGPRVGDESRVGERLREIADDDTVQRRANRPEVRPHWNAEAPAVKVEQRGPGVDRGRLAAVKPAGHERPEDLSPLRAGTP